MDANDPRHGTYAGYVARCRCEPCTTANRREDKRRAMYRMNVGPLIVDSTRAREHITRCLNWGMRYEAFGVSNIGAIHRGRFTTIQRRTERRILAIRPIPGVNCWPAFSASRRLRALIALGHAQATLATDLGVLPSYLSMLVNDVRGWVHLDPETWRKVAALYDRLAMTPGDSTRSRNRAARRGWVPPLAWDDIDDPTEQPQGVRTPKRRDLLAEWHDLRDAGESIEQAAVRLGVTVGAIERAEFRRKAAA